MPLTTTTTMKRHYVSGPDGVVVGDQNAIVTWHFSFLLTSLAANGNIITGLVPGFHGKFLSADFIVHKAVTTASKRADINLEIDGVDVTGGVISITSAAATPAGKIVAGTAITALNEFQATSAIDVELSNVTVHIEGDGTLRILCQVL